MNSKIMLSLATIALFVATAQATYTVETTNHWFSVDASEANLSATEWIKPSGCEATVNTTINVDTAIGNPLTYTNTVLSGCSKYRITGTLTNVTRNATVPTQADFGEKLPVASLVAVAADNKWYGWHLTNAVDGAWVQLDGDGPTADGTEASFTIKVTGANVIYTVGSASGTLTNAKGTSLSGAFGLAGYGSFGDFGAVGFEEFELTVSSDNLVAAGISTNNEAAILAGLNADGANRLPRWQSLVLGLDPTDASAVPYIAPVQTANNKLGFTIGNVNTSKYGVTGANVKFDVFEYSNAAATEGASHVVTNQVAGATAEVTAPTAVKYYKIKIKIER